MGALRGLPDCLRFARGRRPPDLPRDPDRGSSRRGRMRGALRSAGRRDRLPRRGAGARHRRGPRVHGAVRGVGGEPLQFHGWNGRFRRWDGGESGFTTLAALCVGGGTAPIVAASLIVAAASLGFLLFNFPPAKIFMGDVGSSLLGFLAAVGMLWAERAASIPLWVSGPRVLAVHRRCLRHPRPPGPRRREAVAIASRPLLPATRAPRLGASKDRRSASTA